MLNGIRYVSVVLAVLATTAQVVEAKGVQWKTLPECPAKTKLLAGVAKHLRRPIPANVSIRAAIRKHGDGYRVTIHMGNGAVRTLTNRDCFLLTETAALIIALAIDEQSPVTKPDKRVAGISDSERPSRNFGQRVDVRTEYPPQPERPIRLRARALFGTESGTLPTRTSGFGLGAGAHFDWFEVSVAGWYWMERSAHAFSGPVVGGGDFSLFYGELRACLQVRRFGEWALCGAGDAGWMRMAGFSSTPAFQPYTTLAPMFAVGGAAQWSVKIQDRMYLRVGVQAMANLTRPEFVFPPDDEYVHAPSTFSARLSAGVEMLIW